MRKKKRICSVKKIKKKAQQQRNGSPDIHTHTHTLIYGICAQVRSMKLKDSQRMKHTVNTWSMRKMLDLVTIIEEKDWMTVNDEKGTKRLVCVYGYMYLFLYLLQFLRLMYFLLECIGITLQINCQWKVRCHQLSPCFVPRHLLCLSISLNEYVFLYVHICLSVCVFV